MVWSFSRVLRAFPLLMLLFIGGCSQETPSHPLDTNVARESVRKAMQAWVDGKTPQDLKPGIVVGDPAWEQGTKLESFEILDKEENSDGSNLYVRVARKFAGAGTGEAKVTYIVGTSPVVTIFPQ